MTSITKNEPQTQPRQSELFNLSEIPQEPPKPRRNQEMLMGFAGDGSPLWAEHDCRIVRPHVFNTHYQARKEAKKRQGSVRAYRYVK